ncbi:TonB-dependent receptor domain-containing protein [Ereboglobus luteus]|nr:TonB-dependent receptor [Ereboglobus luteus]
MALTQAPAQTATIGSAVPEGDIIMMDRYVVGSHIPWAADAPAVPVRIISRVDIENTGVSGDMLDLLRKQAPQFVGSANIGSNNSNIASNWTNGGSMLSLRSEPTLVLINGRRAAHSPVAALTGFTFVDVNSIPLSAVERIEMLSDGASAIYGADAVSGVVNVILKTNYTGLEVGGNYKFATRSGHWEERSVRAVAGAQLSKTSLTVSFEWLKSDPLYQNERPFSSDMSNMTYSLPGAVYIATSATTGNWYKAVAENTPPTGSNMTADQLIAAGYYTLESHGDDVTVGENFNLSPYVTLINGSERAAGTVSLEHKYNANLTYFGDVLFSNVKTYSQLAGQPITSMPYGATNTDGYGVANANHPQNPFDTEAAPRNRFVDYSRGYKTTTNSLRLLGGARGRINADWHWEGAANYNKASQKQKQTGVIDRDALTAAVDSGIINLFAVEQAHGGFEEAGIFGTAWQRAHSSLFTMDFRVNGTFHNILPAGPIQIAVGVEMRHETLDGNYDEGSYTISDTSDILYGNPVKWDGATGGNPFRDSRDIYSSFLQLRVPITSPAQKIPGLHTLEMDFALRYEKYNDTDDPVVPKILLRYLPINNELAFRATYSQSFNAPALYNLSAPDSVGFTSVIRNVAQHGGGSIGNDRCQAFQLDRSNPNLEPEKSKSFNIGVVYSPKAVKGLELEATYFHIKRTNLIGSAMPLEKILEDVELNGTASRYAQFVHFGGFSGTPVTDPGQISGSYHSNGQSLYDLYYINVNENTNYAMQDGVDFSVRYDLNTQAAGKFGFQVVGTWYNRYYNGVMKYDYAGTTSDGFEEAGSIPRWRANFGVTWNYGDWNASLFGTYIPKMHEVYSAEKYGKVDDYTSIDLAVGYTFRKGVMKGLTARLGCNNAFNKMPPTTWTWFDSYADIGTYGAYGRVIYADVSYKF